MKLPLILYLLLRPQNQPGIWPLAEVVRMPCTAPPAPAPGPRLPWLLFPQPPLRPPALCGLAGAALSPFCIWTAVSFQSVDLQLSRAALMGQ